MSDDKNLIASRLSELRQWMEKYHLDQYFVPARDAHHNEYVPRCWQRRAFMSHFDGSAGDVLIGREQAFLWTDSRYFLQAEQQLDASLFQLMPQAQGAPPLQEWFIRHAVKQTCGVDPKLLSINQAQQFQKALNKVGGQLKAVENNLVDAIWKDQPAIPNKPIRQYPLKHAGVSARNKIDLVRQHLKEKKIDVHVVTALDSIAWLYNIRGNDIDYNPLAISYALVSHEQAILFINPAKVHEGDKIYCQSQGIELQNYDEFAKVLNQISASVWLDPDSASWWVEQQLKKAQIHLEASPLLLLKACKNPTEIAGMHEAHRRDALAMVKFLHWLEQTWPEGVTEISAADELEKFRRQDPECLDLSFATISGFASNGAIVHYRATQGTDRRITDNNLYLIDSGGQYLYGTTDITRTIHLGSPTKEQKQHYTTVLKGHLALRHTLFLAGSCGEHLDAIARRPLWQAGLNYGHGTGHGVGCYLCVHEGPQRISPGYSKIPLEPHMIVSNEPGLYFTDQYGIRIENLCAIVESSHPHFYTFEDLTKVPYAMNLIDINLLTTEEIKWIDDYHREIYELLMDDLNDDQRLWLTQATAPIQI
jgi:Xaa-Pro aminopeptidase